MFTSIVFTAALASTAALLSRADVVPNSPSPGASFNTGAACTLGWAGDASGTNDWKSMSIELMTGSNEDMVHITTVATGQDGTTDGTFSYTCPEVSPNSEIYFYQFTSCSAANTTWTGRFTIAAADGTSTDPTQSELFDGSTVSFGTGTLDSAAAATAAPSCASASGSAASAVITTSASGASGAGAGTSSGFISSQVGKTLAATSSSRTTSSTPSDASAASAAAQATGSSAALAAGPIAVNTRMWPVVVALSASALAFTILL